MECNCGQKMVLDDPHEVMYDFIPGSPEIDWLFLWGVEHPGAQIWFCFGCGAYREPVPA